MNTFTLFAGSVMIGLAVIVVVFAMAAVHPALSEDCSNSWDVPLCNTVLGQLQSMFVLCLMTGGVCLIVGIFLLRMAGGYNKNERRKIERREKDG